ncbi:glutathione S-transferase family protein [Defluviimonas sp. WL0024]|uniref:glutathione transferase n=1 Tax=Albidovulum salinarum TaxID=2984153 RepID=A0ABT2WZS5_9RHOB|nr:glutathione S-transferase family protein [Defluviimonas sp. WL0024]MCU9847181.1 glutathione S-transferase family protein [Defluviimonas sp. WL0024]
MPAKLVLISHHLCPYVQRVAIALAEKGMEFERINIDLSNKPDWFHELSPLGKTPVLTVDGRPIFESAVILEYLEEIGPEPLHPDSALERAEHRGWMEFGSAVLNDIAGLYSAATAEAFEAKRQALGAKFARIEARLGEGELFDRRGFSLVDAVFAPVFRYFDVLDRTGDFAGIGALPRLDRWRRALAARPSVLGAVAADYPERLTEFLRARPSYLAGLMA